MVLSFIRKQSIKRAKFYRQAMTYFHKLRKPLTMFDVTSDRREIFIDTEYGKVRTLWYGLQNLQKTPLFIALHGGGFIMGSPEMDEGINEQLAKQVGCKIVSIDYAKSPEHPYPAAIRQIYAVTGHIIDNPDRYGVDTERMAIGGHSAGGNLSAVVCMMAKKERKFQFVCQVLDYPPLDLSTSPFDKPQPKGCIPPKMAAMFNDCYVDASQAKDPYVSPIFARREDLAGLPPALVILAGRDSLHDEGLEYYRRLQDAGVETVLIDYPAAVHGFTHTPSPDASDAIARIGKFLKQHFE